MEKGGTGDQKIEKRKRMHWGDPCNMREIKREDDEGMCFKRCRKGPSRASASNSITSSTFKNEIFPSKRHDVTDFIQLVQNAFIRTT